MGTDLSTDNPELNRALDIAVSALRSEDRTLSKLFKSASAVAKGLNDQSHRGLGWLREGELVYTIFKAWLRKLPVTWEDRAYKGSQMRADLVVKKPRGAKWEPRW